MKERLMALDYGEKRIGVAISDPLGITAQPYPFISNDDNKSKEISKLIEMYDITTLYIGLPKDTRTGGLTKKAEEVQRFKDQLAKTVSIHIEFFDERRSTMAARDQLREVGIKAKKQKGIIDSQAAAFMLQGVLDRT
tara:strand:+ start:45 stop:455 length:411 start_codon:yes stop_codon:yes gene_type:complete